MMNNNTLNLILIINLLVLICASKVKDCAECSVLVRDSFGSSCKPCPFGTVLYKPVHGGKPSCIKCPENDYLKLSKEVKTECGSCSK